MLRILFVDDEQNVLLGIRRATRSMRHEWEMSFVESGAAALEHFAANDVDVLVTDMRMPGMDGAELLQSVKDRYPGTARIILSGHSDQEAIFRSTTSAHESGSSAADVHLGDAVDASGRRSTSGPARTYRDAAPVSRPLRRG